VTRVAVIDEAVRAEIAALCLHADRHRLSLEDLGNITHGLRPPIGDTPDHALTLAGVYRCVFSVEEHPGGWFRHLSISILAPNPERPLPSPEAVQAIAQAFGFQGNLLRGTIATWIEQGRAVNVVERFASKGNP